MPVFIQSAQRHYGVIAFVYDVNHSDYFSALGYKTSFYDKATGKFEYEEIVEKVLSIQQKWKEKYPLMDFKTQNLRFDSLVNFDLTVTNEMEFLNMEPK